MEKKSWILLHEDTVEVAKDIWDLEKDFRLIVKGEKGDIVQKLVVGLEGGEGNT